jgi:GT2 family glycosyltransferase
MDQALAEHPRISVIIVTWNRAELLRQCLESLRRQTYGNFDVLVVDNASEDETAHVLRSEFADFVQVVRNPENRGFAGGTNAGLKVARGEWIAFLNNDAVADERWLEELAKAVNRHPDAGMFASKILSLQDPTIIDNTGLLLYPDGIFRGRGRNQVDRGQFDGTDEVLVPSGCAALYRRSVLVQLEGLDERFFCYCDDTDLGLAFRITGYCCVYVPSAIVLHAYSGSAGAYSELKAYLVERNRLWLIMKNFPFWMMVASIYYTTCRYFLQLIGALLKRGAFAQFARNHSAAAGARIVARAYLHALRGAPEMWSKRRRLWSKAVLSKREFRRLAHRHRLGLREIALTD